MGALLWWSRFYWPRGTKLFLTVLSLWWSRSFGPRGTSLTCFPCCGCPLSVEPILLTPRYRFIFYSALPVMRSIVWIPRHEFACFPCCGCPLSVEPILLTPRCEFIFCSGSLFDIQTLGLLEVVVADSTLTCFCVCFRFSSFPLKWFPASKRSLWDQAFPCLGNGQHGPHVAPGFLLLPRCGWCRWAPLQLTWRQSATVVSPDQEMDL